MQTCSKDTLLQLFDAHADVIFRECARKSRSRSKALDITFSVFRSAWIHNAADATALYRELQ